MNHTSILISDDEMKVVTVNKPLIRRLERLVEEGHAEELEAEDNEFGYVFAGKSNLVQFRKPREYTEEQRQAARERLAAVRAKPKAKAKTTSKAKTGTRGVAAKK